MNTNANNQSLDSNNLSTNNNSSNAVNNVIVNVTVVDNDNVRNDDSGIKPTSNNVNNCEIGVEPTANNVPEYKINEQQIKEVFNAGLALLNGKPLTKSNIIQVTYILWSVTKKMNVCGDVKREILLTGISSLIEHQQDITDIDKEVLKLMVRDVLGQVIDIVSDAKKAGSKNCLTNCLSYCLGVSDNSPSVSKV